MSVILLQTKFGYHMKSIAYEKVFRGTHDPTSCFVGTDETVNEKVQREIARLSLKQSLSKSLLGLAKQRLPWDQYDLLKAFSLPYIKSIKTMAISK